MTDSGLADWSDAISLTLKKRLEDALEIDNEDDKVSDVDTAEEEELDDIPF